MNIEIHLTLLSFGIGLFVSTVTGYIIGYLTRSTQIHQVPSKEVLETIYPDALLREPEPKTERAALAIDEKNPPSWKVYDPRPGAPTRTCACHPDKPLRPGQKVLWWPVPNSGGGVNVYCEDGVEVEA